MIWSIGQEKLCATTTLSNTLSSHKDGWSGPSDAGMNWFIHALSWREFVQFLNRWLSSHHLITEALNLQHGYCTKNLHHWWTFPTLILHNFVILTSKKSQVVDKCPNGHQNFHFPGLLILMFHYGLVFLRMSGLTHLPCFRGFHRFIGRELIRLELEKMSMKYFLVLSTESSVSKL